MFITVTVKIKDNQIDTRIDSEQKIAVALKVLRESGKMPPGETPDFYRLKPSERLVSAYKTFSDEQIYDGEILEGVC